MDGVSLIGFLHIESHLLTHDRPPADSTRNSTRPEPTKKSDSNLLLDQSNRRPVAERHVSRNSASKLSKFSV